MIGTQVVYNRIRFFLLSFWYPPPLYPSPSIYFLYPVIMGKVAAVGHIITLTVLAWGIALIVIILL